ncbi:MAG: hypothetical protein JJU02_16265 [Cryomorphaceae bacterium]|nr:hypothetical protein [Cryomorphaceae bacterium]
MTYDQQVKFEELLSFISTHTIDRRRPHIDKKAFEENIKWNASLFFAKVIQLAKPSKRELTLEEFYEFKRKYEIQKGTKINADKLFQKHWLRNILDTIKIAGTVSSACHSFKEFAHYYQELTLSPLQQG